MAVNAPPTGRVRAPCGAGGRDDSFAAAPLACNSPPPSAAACSCARAKCGRGSTSARAKQAPLPSIHAARAIGTRPGPARLCARGSTTRSLALDDGRRRRRRRRRGERTRPADPAIRLACHTLTHAHTHTIITTTPPPKKPQTYKRRGLYNIKKKNGGKFPAAAKKQEKKAAAAPKRSPRFYPADDEPKPLAHRAVHRPTKLRASITPGTVLILLAGRFKGKRVVFLSQLPSGLLLVAGPFSANGVPARRVNQAYVIATATKVPLPAGLDLSKLTDAFFKAAEAKKAKKGSDEFFAAGLPDKKAALSPAYVAAQKELDAALSKAVPADLKGYLGARFTLRDGDRPHLMKF